MAGTLSSSRRDAYAFQALTDPTARPGAELDAAKVFAHAVAEMQAAVDEGYPSNSDFPFNEMGFLEVYPRLTSKPPKLLSELQALVASRMRENDKAAALDMGQVKTRDPKLGMNLALAAYREVFDEFIAGFRAYSPLLQEIKDLFDRAIHEGLRHSQENAVLFANIAEFKQQEAAVVVEMRRQVAEEEAQWKREAQAKLREANARSVAAERQCAHLQATLEGVKAEAAKLEAQLAELEASNQQLRHHVEVEAAWQKQPLSAAVNRMTVGPLLPEDEMEGDDGVVSMMLNSAAKLGAGLFAKKPAAGTAQGAGHHHRPAPR